jgi:tetratricopeptide (TPR) repeat protein
MIPDTVGDTFVNDNADRPPLTIPTLTDDEQRNRLAQFRSYLRRNLIYVQRQVSAVDQQLPNELRVQALHTLSYGMGERDLWPLVRALLLAVAPKMELGGHREDWLPYLQQGLAQSQAMQDSAATAECHLQLGLIHRLLSDFDSARRQLTASIGAAATAGEWRTQARALNELAWLEQLLEEYDAAAGHVQQALTLLEEDDVERAVCYRVLGMIAIGHKNWEEAEQLHRTALQLFQQQSDRRRTAWSLHNLAYALREQHRYQDAFALYVQAADTLKEIGDIYHYALALFSLGFTYSMCSDFAQSLLFYRQAEDIFHKLHASYQLAKLYTDMGLAFFNLQDFTNAEVQFLRSAEIFKSLNNVSWHLNALDGLAMTYLAQNKLAEAEPVLVQAKQTLSLDKNINNYNYLWQTINQHWGELLNKKASK